MDETVVAFEKALLAMDRQLARALLDDARQREGASVSVESILVEALEDIGSRWEHGDLALSQVYMSGRICEELIDSTFRANDEDLAATTIGLAVFEDHHTLGKRIVRSALRSAGLVVKDYGRLDRHTALRCLEDDGIEILCLSVLMLNSALHIGGLKSDIERSGLSAKLVVGGAPFRLDERLGAEIGADAVGRNASDAISIVRTMTGAAACQP